MNPRVLFFLLLFPILQADVRQCACDVAKPETMEARECSLCKEVEKSPTPVTAVIVRDINPTKPNRWLALPRKHYSGGHPFSAMAPVDRKALWEAAMAKGKELWGDDWGLAMNGELARTQCHGHVHIGKMREGFDDAGGTFVESVDAIPAPTDGTGLWVHLAANPANSAKRLHVHQGEQINETVLMR